MAVFKSASCIEAVDWTLPSAAELVMEVALVLPLYNRAAWRKLLVSAALPRTMLLPLVSVRVILSKFGSPLVES